VEQIAMAKKTIFTMLLLISTLFLSSCEWEAIEKICIPWQGKCQEGTDRKRIVCNEAGTAWVDANCSAGTFCTDGFCSYSSTNSNIVIDTESLPSGENYVDYSVQLTASGGIEPYSWQIIGGELPKGIGLSSGGVISGNSTEVGIFNVTIRVLDAGLPPGFGSSNFDLALDISPLTIKSDMSYEYMGIQINILPILIPYVEYNAQLGAIGGLPPHKWSESTPPSMLNGFITYWGLPPELSMDWTGKIFGTVTSTADANSITIPGQETTLTGYFLYMKVIDSQESPEAKEGLFMIPTIPMK
jgi:Putative Ig domain